MGLNMLITTILLFCIQNGYTKTKDPDSHIHRCEYYHYWSHSNKMKGNLAAHTCPECNKEAITNRFGNWMPVEYGFRITKDPIRVNPKKPLETWRH